MLGAYDDYLDDHHVLLVDAYEREGAAPPSREQFDDLERWAWERGTERRDCIVDLGASKRWREHRFWACTEEALDRPHERDSPSLRGAMAAAAESLETVDVYAYLDDCATVGSTVEELQDAFPWRDCTTLGDDGEGE